MAKFLAKPCQNFITKSENQETIKNELSPPDCLNTSNRVGEVYATPVVPESVTCVHLHLKNHVSAHSSRADEILIHLSINEKLMLWVWGSKWYHGKI